MARHRTAPKVNVTVAVEYEFVQWADELADRIRSTRSQVIRDAADLGRVRLDQKHPRRQAPVSAADLPFPGVIPVGEPNEIAKDIYQKSWGIADYASALLEMPEKKPPPAEDWLMRSGEPGKTYLAVRHHGRLKAGDRVQVAWGEARGRTGTITGEGGPEGAYYVAVDINPHFSGMFLPYSLRLILDTPPDFASEEEAEDWLMRSGEQEYFPGDIVRLSSRRDREKDMRDVQVVRYLGITAKEPPKYLVVDQGEPLIVASYFLKGMA